MDALPFRKPEKKARLQTPIPEDRKKMLDSALAFVAAAETDPEFVGYAFVALMSDGTRRSDWNCIRSGTVQLQKQLRREATLIAQEALKEST